MSGTTCQLLNLSPIFGLDPGQSLGFEPCVDFPPSGFFPEGGDGDDTPLCLVVFPTLLVVVHRSPIGTGDRRGPERGDPVEALDLADLLDLNLR